MKNLHCPNGHRVYKELNKELGYPYFCPKCNENYFRIELHLETSDRIIAHLVESGNGLLWLNKSGDVLLQKTTKECSKVVWFDLEEYEEIWEKKPEYHIDILDIRGILANGNELVWSDYKKIRAGETL